MTVKVATLSLQLPFLRSHPASAMMPGDFGETAGSLSGPEPPGITAGSVSEAESPTQDREQCHEGHAQDQDQHLDAVLSSVTRGLQDLRFDSSIMASSRIQDPDELDQAVVDNKSGRAIELPTNGADHGIVGVLHKYVSFTEVIVPIAILIESTAGPPASFVKSSNLLCNSSIILYS